jgi:pentatricopeptide repeat protein
MACHWTCRADGPFTPDVVSFNTVIKMLAAAGHITGAFSLLSSMTLAGVAPRVATFALLLAAAARQGDSDLVYRTWRYMASAQVVPDTTCLSILLGTLVETV